MFKIIKESENARLGVLKTKSGEVETPFFMPVATKAAPKFLSF
jgi:queuine tRNA-ribosyltransferase